MLLFNCTALSQSELSNFFLYVIIIIIIIIIITILIIIIIIIIIITITIMIIVISIDYYFKINKRTHTLVDKSRLMPVLWTVTSSTTKGLL